MKKHILNLQRLHKKMRSRYGENDDLVFQLTQEIKHIEALHEVSKIGVDRRQLRDKHLLNPAPPQ